MFKLLIVEDEKSILEELVYALEDDGYQVFKALTGADAMSIIREQKPEIIILDLYLQDMSGLRMIREAKPLNPKTCVIVLTGFDYMHIKEKAKQMGVDYFLIKPVPLATLKDFISAAVKTITE